MTKSLQPSFLPIAHPFSLCASLSSPICSQAGPSTSRPRPAPQSHSAALLRICTQGKVGDWYGAHLTFHLFKERALPTQALFGAYISALAQSRRFDFIYRAYRNFEHLDSARARFSFISALAKSGKIDEAKVELLRAAERGLATSGHSWGAVLRGLCLHGRINEARMLLRTAERYDAADAGCYEAVIRGLGRTGKVKNMVEELRNMKESGIDVSEGAFEGLIHGCVGKGGRAWVVWRASVAEGKGWGKGVVGAAASACLRERWNLERAECVLRAMEAITDVDELFETKLKGVRNMVEKRISNKMKGDGNMF